MIETDENGTSVFVNSETLEIPEFFKDYFIFNTEQSNKLFAEMKSKLGDKFSKFFEDTEDIGEVRSTDDREIIEETHELIYKLFSHEIKQWALAQYESFDETSFGGI